MAQMIESKFPHTYLQFCLMVSVSFHQKINVLNSFKVLPTSNSNVFFLWFGAEISRITSSPKKTFVKYLYTARVDKNTK